MKTTPPNFDGAEEIPAGFPLDLPPNSDGRDEMNLAEYPIALLADRAPKDVKTLVYKDRDETLTITGSDLLGLPTALDIDVVIGLLHLTKKKNDFTDRTLSFTRYELLQVLRWSHRGRHYERITESLNRWVGVTLIYKKAWWDNDQKTKGNASFHIIDAANIVERSDSPSRQQQLPLSTIRWGEEFFRSCQANNLKRLDLEVYFSLESSISKQLYRFLDKRFYRKWEWTFDLRTLACEHVGLSRNYPSWKIKQKLDPAIEELTEAGFLRRMGSGERYKKVARGEWTVTFAKCGSRLARSQEQDNQPEATPLERELINRGVTSSTARELVAAYPEERIAAQVEHFDWLKEKHPKKVSGNPGGFLASAIRDDYAPLKGFETKADREKRLQAEEAKQRTELEESRRKRAERTREDELDRRIKDRWDAMTPSEQASLEAQALADADEETRETYETAFKPAKRLVMIGIRQTYLRKLIEAEALAAPNDPSGRPGATQSDDLPQAEGF